MLSMHRTNHTTVDCKYKQEKCHACGKLGHLARACRSKAKKSGFVKTKKETKQSSQYHSHKVHAEDVTKSDISEPLHVEMHTVHTEQSVQIRTSE